MLILEQQDDEPRKDEIPDEIRHEFNLPAQVNFYEVNFNEIRK